MKKKLRVHNLLNPDLWKWPECQACKSCHPEASHNGAVSPSCDRCMMFNDNGPDRFIPNKSK